MTTKKTKTFEENLQELDKIVKDLESGNVSLDLAITKFNEAMKLAKECSDKLKTAEEAINQVLKEDGTLTDFVLNDE